MQLQAFVLAALVWSGRVQYWHVAGLALIYGLGRAIDIPARQSYITDLVGRSDLANAVALNSVVMNGARIVGPAVAGLLIAAFGVALAFFLNGVSFVAVLVALVAIRTQGRPDGAGRLGIGEGVLVGLRSAAATPHVAFTIGCNTTLQLIAPNQLRGRVMGLCTVTFAGMTPFGSLLVGFVAEHQGVRAACAAGGAIGLLGVGVLVAIAHRAGIAWTQRRAP